MTDAEKLALVQEASDNALGTYDAIFRPQGELLLARRRWGEGPDDIAVDVFLLRETPDGGEARCLADAVDPLPPVVKITVVEDEGIEHWCIASCVGGPPSIMLPIDTSRDVLLQVATTTHHCTIDEVEVED